MINGLNVSVYQELLHAEIQYHAGNYNHALKGLAQLVAKVDQFGKYKEMIKNIVDHNVALILANYNQTSTAKLMLNKALNFFMKDKETSN